MENDKSSQELQSLKEKYSVDYLKTIENDVTKIACLYRNVFVSLAFREKLPPTTNKKPKYSFNCLFEECQAKKIAIISKQGFLRHTILKHGCLIPGSGRFLMPNSIYFLTNMTTECKKCNQVFGSVKLLNSHNQDGVCKNMDQTGDQSNESVSSGERLLSIESNEKLALMWHQDWHNENRESDEIYLKELSNEIKNESESKQPDGRSKMQKRELSSYSINGADEKKAREDICSDEDDYDYNHFEFDSGKDSRDFNESKNDDENSLQSLPEKLSILNY